MHAHLFQFWFEGAWILNETSRSAGRIEDLISIAIVYNGNDPKSFISGLNSDLANSKKYSKVRTIVGIILNQNGDSPSANEPILQSVLSNVVIETASEMSESEMWLKLIRKVSTDYVLVGRDIQRLNPKVKYVIMTLL